MPQRSPTPAVTCVLGFRVEGLGFRARLPSNRMDSGCSARSHSSRSFIARVLEILAFQMAGLGFFSAVLRGEDVRFPRSLRGKSAVFVHKGLQELYEQT